MDTTLFFDTFYLNAKHNCVLIMDTQGNILNINNAFKLRFGYEEDDLKGQNLAILFIEKDKETKKPEREVQQVLTEGSAKDENYLLDKEGNKIWVTGESVLVENDRNEKFIVKVVHNIHAQKQLERFLLQSHEFIDAIFDSISDAGLLLLDTSIRVLKANNAFLNIFELKQPIAEGTRLTEIDNVFWHNPEVRQQAVNFLVTNDFEEKIFKFENKEGNIKKISFQGKLLDGSKHIERRLLIMIKPINNK